eukprot:TRINITY_DN14921_c0_g1_i1.p1 TRINITY_DN14921_c0_g1~~TRINITY_DN14921_c0_g1_i1.p1  ORF type:complete len:492 (+),score=95.52 TRINITY_DN14921_c0_g1_i1:147-1622(+)
MLNLSLPNVTSVHRRHPNTSSPTSNDLLEFDFVKKRTTWREIRDVGRGCFGEIRLIEDPETGLRFVKKLIPGLITDEKIKNEISCMTRLQSHKNIVKMYDAYQVEDPQGEAPFTVLILELAEGGDLLEYIKRRQRLSEGEARSMFSDILSALDFSHREFILHRDIKAENVFLDKSFSPRIGDWGFAGAWHPDETLDVFCGSLHYSAPEICSGTNYIGPEVDIWSLGALLYAMICGSLPFSGETEWQIFEKIRVANFRLPPFVTSGAADLLLRMLQVSPKKRATMSEIKRHPWVLGSSLAPLISNPSRPIHTISAPMLIGNDQKKTPSSSNHQNHGFSLGKKIKERFMLYKMNSSKKSSLAPIAEDQPDDNVIAMVSPPGSMGHEVHFDMEETDEEHDHEQEVLSPQRALSRGLDKDCRRKFSLGRLFVRLHNVSSGDRKSPKVSPHSPSSSGHANQMIASVSTEQRKHADTETKSNLPSRLKRLSTAFVDP